jgi:hypothetical protein
LNCWHRHRRGPRRLGQQRAMPRVRFRRMIEVDEMQKASNALRYCHSTLS